MSNSHFRALGPVHRRHLVAGSVFLVFTGSAGIGSAQDGVEPSLEAGLEVDSDAAEEAGRLFQESVALYRDGDFAAAAERLERAYALDPEPVLLYNLARAYEGDGEVAPALEAYRRYLSEEPSPADRGAIERRIETLEAQLEERRQAAALAASRRRAAPDRSAAADPSSPSAVPWIVASVGAVALGAGAVFGLLSRLDHEAAIDDPSFESALRGQDQAIEKATVANVLFVSGGVVAAAGLLWGILDIALSGGDTEVAITPDRLMLRHRF